MGYYAYELHKATTTMNKESFDEVLTKIKEEVGKDKWKGYGWRDSVLNAETFEEALEEFGILLEDEGNGNYRPVINDVYVSNFFESLAYIVAPYMTCGEIEVEHDYGAVTIVFEDGKVNVY